jgi:hypothetical protein
MMSLAGKKGKRLKKIPSYRYHLSCLPSERNAMHASRYPFKDFHSDPKLTLPFMTACAVSAGESDEAAGVLSLHEHHGAASVPMHRRTLNLQVIYGPPSALHGDLYDQNH